MAENSLEKIVKALEKDLTCAVCHERYTEPKSLPCCHCYCKKCIHSLALRTGLDKPFSCPECRKDTTLPQGGVDNLPPAFLVNRMKEFHSTLQQAHDTVEEVKCEFCSLDRANAFCRNCAQFICDECVKSHQRMKLFSKHEVATLAEIKEMKAEDIIQSPSIEICEVHEQPLNIYCSDCNTLICRDCTIDKTHNSHDHEFVKRAAPKAREQLKQQLDQLKQTKANLSLAVEKIRATKSQVGTQGDSVAVYIKSSLRELRTIIENCEQELLLNSSENVSQKLERLSVQEKSLSAASTSVQSVITYAEQCIRQADNDVMSAYSDIQDRIQCENEEQRRHRENLEPVEEVDMGIEVNCAEELKQLCQTKAKIVRLALVPKKCTVTLAETKVAEVGEFELVTKLSNGMSTTRKCTVDCCLKSLANESTYKCETFIDSVIGSKYRVKYRPTVHGPNQLIVTVNGEEVAGSPFDVFVHIQPGQLGKPVRCFTGFNNPRDIAINSSGEIIITEQKGIVVYDKNRKIVRSYKSSEFRISDLYCVAIDSTDNIYLTGTSGTSHRIVKLNSMFELVKEYSTKEKHNFRGLAVTDDKVIVCQRDKGISFYTKELKQLVGLDNDLITDQFRGVRDVSLDEDGKFYVSDYDSSRILVFKSDCEFSHSFSSDESGENKLKGPRGVCVAGKHLYVTNWHSHTVSVFTTEGEYVTTFGQKGGSEGNFRCPWGVCVDRDDFVYVCDQGRNRVQMF